MKTLFMNLKSGYKKVVEKMKKQVFVNGII